jgi:peptide/nickel transport system substrate-binding protein
MRPPPTAFILLSLFVSACGGAGDDGPIAVSVIGRQPELVDPNRQALSAPSAALLLATAQGLVRFDGDGQIEPGLAIRWAVSDDGLYYTFRLPDDAAINAEKVARLLRAMIAPGSQNPVKPLLGTVDEIVAVTPEVVEIRLHAPQPRLLELFAQPEMALVTNGSGTGPFAIAIRDRGALVLNLMRPEQEAVDAEEDGRSDRLRLRGERAARAIARFQVGNARLVTGGSFADLPIVQVARPPAAALRFDPVHGLFGLAVVEREGFLGNVDHRRALAMALRWDRVGDPRRPRLRRCFAAVAPSDGRAAHRRGAGAPTVARGVAIRAGRADPLHAAEERLESDRGRCRARTAGGRRRFAPDRRGRAHRLGRLVSRPLHLRRQSRV